jgi:hypothetical protein
MPFRKAEDWKMDSSGVPQYVKPTSQRMFQSTAGSIRRLTPSRRIEAGWIVPSLKEGVTGKVCPATPGVKRESP